MVTAKLKRPEAVKAHKKKLFSLKPSYSGGFFNA